jgi:hypothetical protein
LLQLVANKVRKIRDGGGDDQMDANQNQGAFPQTNTLSGTRRVRGGKALSAQVGVGDPGEDI